MGLANENRVPSPTPHRTSGGDMLPDNRRNTKGEIERGWTQPGSSCIRELGRHEERFQDVRPCAALNTSTPPSCVGRGRRLACPRRKPPGRSALVLLPRRLRWKNSQPLKMAAIFRHTASFQESRSLIAALVPCSTDPLRRSLLTVRRAFEHWSSTPSRVEMQRSWPRLFAIFVPDRTWCGRSLRTMRM